MADKYERQPKSILYFGDLRIKEKENYYVRAIKILFDGRKPQTYSDKLKAKRKAAALYYEAPKPIEQKEKME